MTRVQHLIAILGEEGVEVSQRTTKALRFGLNEIQPEQEFDNSERIMIEMSDMIAVYETLVDEGILPPVERELVDKKKEKVEKFLRYSDEQGMVTK
mgnify:FL=1|jgi:hypothetical protein